MLPLNPRPLRRSHTNLPRRTRNKKNKRQTPHDLNDAPASPRVHSRETIP
jgi:hypothetical protein